MKKVLKWICIVLAGLVGLIFIAAALIFILSNARFRKTYKVPVAAVNIPVDAETLASGEHIARSRGCTDCHGENLAGETFSEDPALGFLYASNLTAGQGGIGGDYRDEDYVRAIRHGLGPDGKPLLYMPSQEFYYLSDEDLGALVAYLKTLPQADNVMPENSVGPLGRILFVAGQLPLVPAELIDHTAARPQSPAPGVTVEYGQYLSVGCIGCHGPAFAGGTIPGGPPGAPPASNLTPAGNLSGWNEGDFIQVMRSGTTPEGVSLDGEWMPWRVFGEMTDEELKALWLFLQTLPEAG